jgi:RNA polymerase sigma factor (sigma-70 family)
VKGRPIYELIRKRPKEGIKLLYDQYGKKLYGYAVHSWKLTEDEAWDLVYKALYNTVEKIEKYRFENDAAFGSFLFTIFINLIRNHLRDKKELVFENLENIPEPGNETQEMNEDHQKLISLKNELERLEDWERVLLLLRSQGLPYAEIAKYTGKSPDVLKVYYGRLKEKLANKMNQDALKKELK